MTAIPDPGQLPPELLQLKRFILWKEEIRGSRATKIPLAPWRTGHWNAANPLDPDNWVDFNTAMEWARKMPGVGIGIVLGGGLVGIDLDDVIDERGNVKREAQEIIERADSYTELSPSGKGIHILIRGSVHHPIKLDWLEVYSDGRYFTLTGWRLKTAPLILRNAQDLIDELTQRYIEKTVSPIRKRGEKNIPILGVYEAFGGDLTKLKRRGKHLQGPHPVHGSETGFNFSIDPEKNVWFCYRHWHGGGPVSLAAIMAGIIKCEEFGPMGLTGTKLKQTLELLREKGLVLGPEGESEWDRVWGLVTSRTEDIFLDEEGGEPWITVRIGESPPQTENIWICSDEFDKWLCRVAVEEFGKGIRPETRSILRETLAGMAYKSHKRKKLWLLSAPDVDKIWIDPGWSSGEKILVTPEGWKVVDGPTENPHHRSRLMLPLPMPVLCDDPRSMLKKWFVPPNVDGNASAAEIVLTVYPCTLPLSHIPRAGLALLGDHGSGKTVYTRRMLRLWGVKDPVTYHENDVRDLIAKLRWLPIVAIDNLRHVSCELADLLSCAITGIQWVSRELYTDVGVKAFTLCRAVLLNGINPSIWYYPDLLDRFLVIRLRKLREEERKYETELWKEFQEQHGEILGAALTSISRGMALLSEVRQDIHEWPRMADWTMWGEAIARGMGYKPLEFLNAYRELMGETTGLVLEEDPLGRAVLAFVETLPADADGRREWIGSPKDLLEALEQTMITKGEHLPTLYDQGFPKTPVWLGRKLREIAGTLLDHGVEVVQKRVGTTRIIRLTKR